MKKLWINEVVNKIGQEVEIFGWVNGRRDHGKIIFLDIRDRSGIVQVVFTPSQKDMYGLADGVRPQWLVRITGKVVERPTDMANLDIPTGAVELQPKDMKILSQAGIPPIPLDTDGYELDETLRLKYRYLDLRRPRLQKNLVLRHRVSQFVRNYLSAKDFVEVETPLLTKPTPEGSRDFLVPSRLQPGKFYALPQSPQQYKQLLMVAGMERYFQLARALRDEDLRANRTFEHTQIDLEMSFVEQKDVMQLVEGLLTELFENFGRSIIQKPFPIFTFRQSIKQFGADKFDLRKSTDPAEIALAWVINFPVFERDEKTGALTYCHNPFTAPRKEDVEKLLRGEDLENLISLQYDLVCNGQEIGGGGIRINQPEVLRKVFEVLGHGPEDIEQKFGHMLEAFNYGVPPHGGIALGLDRIVSILTNESAIREVIAFPTTSGGQTAVMHAPDEADREQLKELGIEVSRK